MAAAASKKKEREHLTFSEARIRAMNHPVRARIFRHIIEKGESSAVESSHELGIDLSKASYHCRKLQELGCVELVRSEAVRGSVKHYLRPTERQLVDQPEWKELDPLSKDHALSEALQPMVDDAESAARAGLLEAGEQWITRTPIKGLDAEGYAELLAAHRALWLQGFEIEKRSAARVAQSGEETTPVSTSQSVFRLNSF